MLTVAIAAENDDYDAEIYRTLLELLLGQPITRYPTARRFSGCRSVRDLSEAYLRDADRQGVTHALFAIDNDGGAKRAPEHDQEHDAPVEAVNEDGCRACWLAEVLPRWWTINGSKRCLVVPVQTLETWLLCVRGDPFSAPSPEQQYGRPVLKKRFFGKPEPPAQMRCSMALAELSKPGALAILRQRRSFQHFEAQLADWV
ncbi:MAG: hypothetical protein ABI134_13920 [Byssovorax sp.]